MAELEGSRLSGEIELDESYFGGRRKGQRGRGAKGKSIVFGLLERDGRVCTKVVEEVTADELMSIIRKKNQKGIGLLHRSVQKLQLFEAPGQTSHRQAWQTLC